jgi:TatD DNase family protein
MIDVHCHLQFKAFENDYDAVIKDAFDAGLTAIINTGTQLSSSRNAVEFAERYENLFAIVGVHPHHADKIKTDPEIVEATEGKQKKTKVKPVGEDYWLKELEKLTHHPKVLAIGEIGLDYYQYKSNGIVDPELQKEIFIKQIELAYKVGLPLQIHNRLAGEDIIEILEQHRQLLQTVPGMFHCFAGTKEVLKSALDMGFFIGFDGNSTYKGLAPGETVALSELAQLTPLDRIVIETDAPYLTPIPHRGQRNQPRYAILTARFISECKGVSYERLVEQTDKNVYTLFRRMNSYHAT